MGTIVMLCCMYVIWIPFPGEYCTTGWVVTKDKSVR